MSTKFVFFDHNGARLYARSDAVSFEHYCESLSFEGEFPLTEHLPEVGQLIGWQDDDELWQVHEISQCSMSVTGDSIEISGNHIIVAELGACAVALHFKLANALAKNALLTILHMQPLWQAGVLPSAAEDDELRRQRYRVTASRVNMYAYDNLNAKRISRYKKGKYLTPVEKRSDYWWLMQGSDGRVGWIPWPVRDLVRDGNSGDETVTVSMDEKFASLWDLLRKWQDATGYHVIPRVEVGESGIVGRYVDVQTGDPDYRGVRITCSSNVADGALRYNIANLYTALAGFGKDDLNFRNVVWTKAGGFPADKPGGEYFIGSPEALAQFGHSGVHRSGVIHFENCIDADELLLRTYEALLKVSVPEICFDGTVADLYRLGYGGQSMRLYDKVHFVFSPLKRHVEMQITGLTRDLVHPENTKPVFGSLAGRDIVTSIVSAASSAASIRSWQLQNGAVSAINIPKEDEEEGDRLNISGDGIHAELIEAGIIRSDSVLQTYEGGEVLVGSAAELNTILGDMERRSVRDPLILDCSAVTGGVFEVKNVIGAQVTLRGGTFNALTVKDSSAHFLLENVTFAASDTALLCDRGWVTLQGCSVNAANVGETAVGLCCRQSGVVIADGCQGDCNVFAEAQIGGSIYVTGDSIPYGAMNTSGGDIYTNRAPRMKPTPPPPEPETLTLTLPAILTWNYGASGNNSNHDIWIGRYNTGNLNRGCIWFDLSTLRAKIANGYSVSAATLTIKRYSGIGGGGNAQCNIYGTTASTSGGTPPIGAQYATVAMPNGAQRSVDVTTLAAALGAGTYNGIMLYNPDTATYSSKTYTYTYSRYYGYTTAGAPVLRVTLQK